jgi:ribosome-binding protein aMBF1 (putative translation factor)
MSKGINRGKKGIDWDEQPLGQEADQAIATRLGVSKQAVHSARCTRGITALHRGVPPNPRYKKTKAPPTVGTLGRCIRDARKKRRMDQGDLARLLGAAKSQVSMWERNRHVPRNLGALAFVLGVRFTVHPDFRWTWEEATQ